MPGFRYTLVGVGPLCDADCTVTFTHEAFIVRYIQGTAVLTGWSEATWVRLWRISLQPGESNLPKIPNNTNMATLAAYIAYDLTIVAALITYFHAASRYQFRYICLKEIGAWNYSSWPGLTLANVTKYCPSADATIIGHLVQKRQWVRSTKPNPPSTSSPEDPIPQFRSNELCLQVTPISKLYTNDTGRFPIHACSGNQYIMIAYHCNANMILSVPFKSRKDTHRLIAYDKIMQRLRNHKLTVDLQILDNGAST